MYLSGEMYKSLVVITPRYYPLTGTIDLDHRLILVIVLDRFSSKHCISTLNSRAPLVWVPSILHPGQPWNQVMLNKRSPMNMYQPLVKQTGTSRMKAYCIEFVPMGEVTIKFVLSLDP